ncbi:hypothetical protein NHQ30_010534 [Ciborinia camelliae]|nr:hypothetical protein NHQ30_010534 [Ciborinia camelliae]
MTAPSARNTILKLAATMKKPISLTNVFLPTLNSLTKAIDPATTAVINPAAPMSSPTARLPLCEPIAANVENTSGLPLPKARNVTPAILSLIPNMLAIVDKLIQKKSLAAIPIVENNNASHSMRMARATGWAFGSLQ